MLQYEKRTSKMSNVPPRQRRIFASLQGKKGEKAQETRKIPRNEQSFFYYLLGFFPWPPPPRPCHLSSSRNSLGDIGIQKSATNIQYFGLHYREYTVIYSIICSISIFHNMILDTNVRRDCHFRQIGQTLFKGQGKKILQTAN